MTPTERACFLAGVLCAAGAELLRLFAMAFLHDGSIALAILPK